MLKGIPLGHRVPDGRANSSATANAAANATANATGQVAGQVTDKAAGDRPLAQSSGAKPRSAREPSAALANLPDKSNGSPGPLKVRASKNVASTPKPGPRIEPDDNAQLLHEQITGAVRSGGLRAWSLQTQGGAPKVAPEDVAEQWKYSRNDSDSQRTSTRLAGFILDGNPKLHGTELQAVASRASNRIVMSMNNGEANEKLQKRYGDAARLKDHLGEFIAEKLRTAPQSGASPLLNTDDKLRRAQKLFNWLGENPDVVLTVTDNPSRHHAEISVRLTIEENYPEMLKEGRAAGSKPPCLGCVLWFNDRDELTEYQDEEHKVPAGPLFLTPDSGLRTQFATHGVEPMGAVTPTVIGEVADTVKRQVSGLKLDIRPVTSGRTDNIPRSPTDDEPDTADYTKAFEFGKPLFEQKLAAKQKVHAKQKRVLKQKTDTKQIDTKQKTEAKQQSDAPQGSGSPQSSR
ncbi:hypothetical protein [Paraburkholderia strydomiana]|uniref:hypothetical protein n=1 Tax=Paraburkholderia strydomiana TaxID=1245417 RepID=UPI001BE863D0|nr:hypothetical protein [Paraburkholderia strydomiana]MBT2793430.1 hypothetical protein [Paraburkholderia strydomiana]